MRGLSRWQAGEFWRRRGSETQTFRVPPAHNSRRLRGGLKISKNIIGARLRLFVHGWLLLGTALAASAQQEPPVIQKLEKIEVTGSHIPRVEGETALPVQIIKREEIERSGAATAAELLNRVSANVNGFNDARSIGNSNNPGFAGASLRGLGEGSTLVLLNGRRLANYAFNAAAVDLNSIPLAAVERVEILKDGASAIYGTDAIAGVINFITRKDYHGAKFTGQLGETEHGGGGHKQATVSAGLGNLSVDRFNIFATLDYQKDAALRARDRTFSRTGFIPAEGVNQLLPTAFPANIRVGRRGIFNPLLATGCAPPVALPTTNNDVFAAPFCGFDPASLIDILPPSERTNLVGRATFQLNADHQLFAEYVYSHNRFLFGVAPTPVAEFFTFNHDPILYPVGGPFYPTAFAAANGISGDLRLAYRTVPLGPRKNLVKTDAQRLVLGAEGLVAGWNYNAALSHSENSQKDILASGYVSEQKLLDALATGLINPFGPSGPEGDALLAGSQIMGEFHRAKGTTDNIDARFSREITQLAAGPLALALGTEARREKLDDIFAPVANSGDILAGGGQQNSKSESRSVQSAFAELNIPIVKGLEAQLAARYDHYSDFGNTTNPKIALRWQPAKTLLLRTSYGTGFRAPTLPDLFTPLSRNFTDFRSDPQRCPVTNLETDCDAQFKTFSGGNPKLKPEESEQFTLGVVWEPVTGFSVGLDFWKINKTQAIGTLTEETLFQSFARFEATNIVRGPVDPAFPNLPGPIQTVLETNQNLGNLRTSGVDLELAYLFPRTSIGRFSLNLNGTYSHDWRQQIDGVNYISNLGLYVNGSAVQRWRHTLALNWDNGAWGATLAQIYFSGYTDSNAEPGQNRRVAPYDVWDIQGSYSGIRNFKFVLGIRNLFDRAPPFSNQEDTFQLGYDPHYADPRGRLYYGRLTYSFN